MACQMTTFDNIVSEIKADVYRKSAHDVADEFGLMLPDFYSIDEFIEACAVIEINNYFK